jgi:hypothetical protein
MWALYGEWPRVHLSSRAQEEWSPTSPTSVHEDMERADDIDPTDGG